MTPKELLGLPMGPNDAEAATVRGYLTALLTAVWTEKEGFSGKRPFGNSSWECDLYVPLIKAGAVEGTFDEDGYLDTFTRENEAKAGTLILDAIKALGGSDPA